MDPNFGAPLERQSSSSNAATQALRQIANPPGTRAHIKRKGSRLLSAIRSWTRSRCKDVLSECGTAWLISLASNSSDSTSPPLKHVKLDLPTVVIRSQFKKRPSIVDISIDKEIFEATQEPTPPTSPSLEIHSSPSSGKSSGPIDDSTGKTSFDSKFFDENAKLTPIAEACAESPGNTPSKHLHFSYNASPLTMPSNYLR